LLKNIQVDVPQNAVLGHRNKRIDDRIGEDIAVYLRVITNVGYELVIGHVITTDTGLIFMVINKALFNAFGVMLIVLLAVPML
jgi:hypothetical protein